MAWKDDGHAVGLMSNGWVLARLPDYRSPEDPKSKLYVFTQRQAEKVGDALLKAVESKRSVDVGTTDPEAAA